MRHSYRVAQVRAAELELMTEVAEPDLMRIASTGLARAAAAAVGNRVAGRRVAALVGSGNNGGDVLFAAADLAALGAEVTAVTMTDTWHAAGAEALVHAGGRLCGAAGSEAGAAVRGAELVLDGIVGIGASGPLRPAAAALVAMINDSIVVAADIPSGVNPDDGTVADPARVVRADITVTFGCLKPGLLLQPGRDAAGVVELVDIGLDAHLAGADPAVSALETNDARRWFAELRPDDYKYSHGVVGVAAGSAEYPGAAHMVVAAARHGGVGMVRLHADATSRDAAIAVVEQFPDVVITAADPAIDPRATGWAVGPGMGIGPASAAVLRSVLMGSRPAVVDADALTMVARDSSLRGLLREREPATVVTPHVGEFERMGFDVGGDRVAAARAAAEELRAIVVLKGAGTIVAEPSGRVFTDLISTSALATAGTGDVLAGILGAAVARAGAEADGECVAAAVLVHGLAGRLAAEGGFPATAWDIAAAVPRAVAAVRR